MSGDEFCCITRFPEQTKSFLTEFSSPDKTLDEIPFKGVSYGAAAFPSDAQEVTMLIQTADQRMYQAKKHGR